MTDTTAPPLDLAEVEARINRHRCSAVHSGDRDFVEVSQILDRDAPALVAEVRRLRAETKRLRAYIRKSEEASWS